MPAELRTVRQCLRCGAVTGDIRAAHKNAHVDAKAVLMYENPLGKDFGYTPDGRLIRGEIIKERTSGGGYWEVFPVHRCGADKEDRVDEQGQAGRQAGRRWNNRR